MLKQLYSKHLLFIVFAFSIFIKNVLFRMATEHLDMFDVLFDYPGVFTVFWVGKLLPAVFLASFVYLFRRQWWTIAVNIVIDVWVVANVFYFKANGAYLSPDVMSMAGNLAGFEDSVLALFGWEVCAILLISFIYIVVYKLLNLSAKTTRSNILFAVCMLLVLIADCFSNYYYRFNFYHDEDYKPLGFREKIKNAWPFGLAYNDATLGSGNSKEFSFYYMHYQSAVSYFPAMFLYNAWAPDNLGEKLILSEDQLQEIEQVPILDVPRLNAERNLIFVLVESLESWPLDETEGVNFMPFLSRLRNQEHVFSAEHLKCQIQNGISGDGQFISVTGLLPLKQGVTCHSNWNNKFPNFASSFEESAILNPSPGTWNQTKVTPSYGFNNLIEPDSSRWYDDETIIHNTINYLDSVNTSPFCLLTLTVSSHIPFSYGADHPKYKVNGMPSTMQNYLNSLSYADSCINLLVDRVVNSDLANNTIIVITGDHTAFRSSAFGDMDDYAADHGIKFHGGDNFLPLIIYSPDIVGNEHYEGEAYQMDVFPTVCALIDSTAVVHTLGVNLRDSVAVANRKITEAEAYRLSDMIIRSDYFGQERKDSVDCQ